MREQWLRRLLKNPLLHPAVIIAALAWSALTKV